MITEQPKHRLSPSWRPKCSLGAPWRCPRGSGSCRSTALGPRDRLRDRPAQQSSRNGGLCNSSPQQRQARQGFLYPLHKGKLRPRHRATCLSFALHLWKSRGSARLSLPALMAGTGHLCWSCSGSRAPPRCPLWVGLTHALGPEVPPCPPDLMTAGELTTRM